MEFGGAELSEKVANLFNELFPLVLLAIEEDPLPAIQDYLQVGNGAPVAPPPLPPPVPTPPPIQPEYPLATCAAETGFDVPTLETWVRAVNRKGQAIIYGPPGTGKTIGAIKGGLTLHKCAKSKRLSMPPVHGNGFLLMYLCSRTCCNLRNHQFDLFPETLNQIRNFFPGSGFHVHGCLPDLRQAL